MNRFLPNLLILLSVAGRLIPHPANMTPVGAAALVGGSRLDGVWRWVTPFVALALSDLLLYFIYGFKPWSLVTLFIYASFAINIFLGRRIGGNQRYLKLGLFSVAGSLQFFLISNFGVWMEGLLYPQTWEGLVQCYAMAIPFLKNSLAGDLAWSFGLFAIIDRSRVWAGKKLLQPS